VWEAANDTLSLLKDGVKGVYSVGHEAMSELKLVDNTIELIDRVPEVTGAIGKGGVAVFAEVINGLTNTLPGKDTWREWRVSILGEPVTSKERREKSLHRSKRTLMNLLTFGV